MTSIKQLKTKKIRLIKEIARLTEMPYPPTEDNYILSYLDRLFENFIIIGYECGSKHKCLCGTNSTKNYKLENLKTKNKVFIGSSCVSYFSGLSKNHYELFKKVDKKNEKNIHEKVIDKNIKKILKKDTNSRFNMFGKYIRIRSNKFGKKYYLFIIENIYESFLHKLKENNKKIKYQFWPYENELYIQFEKGKFRFNKNEIYNIIFKINDNNKLKIEKVKKESPICIIDYTSDDD